MASDIKLNDNSVLMEGNVGIGTNNPLRKLHVENSEIHSSGAAGGFSFSDRTKPNEQRWVLYSKDRSTRLHADTRGDVVTISEGGEVKTTGPQAGFSFADRTKSTEGPAVWYCSNGSVNLDFTGEVGSGSASGQVLERLLISGNNKTGVTIYNHARVTGGLIVQDNGQFYGNLDVRGKVTQASSIALKENVAELSGREAIETLDGLNPVKFSYKADAQKEQHIGFIAEEVPDLVANPDRDRLSPMDLIAVLTKAVQEQQKTISQLSAEMNTLKQQNGER